MKKFFAILLVVALIATIGGLSVGLYNTKESLSAAEADIEGMTFMEGKVIEGASGGGIVTVSLKKWKCFEDPRNLTISKPNTSNISNVFNELYSNGLIVSMNGDLVKLKYTKQITISGEGGNTFFLVGNYYIYSSK